MSGTLSGNLRQDAADVERMLTTVSGTLSGSLQQDATDVERTLTTASATVSGALKQDAAEVERTLTPRVDRGQRQHPTGRRRDRRRA